MTEYIPVTPLIGLQPAAEPLPIPVERSKHRFGQIVSRAGLAAVCVVPVADLALSDGAFAKAYQAIDNKIELTSPVAEQGLQMGTMGGVVMAESVLLGLALTKTKRLQNSFGKFDEYTEQKQSQMGPVRKAISAAANSPLKVIGALGSKVESLGDKIQESESPVKRELGQLIVDAGHVNAVGTSTVILNETMQGSTPDLRRITRLGALIAGSWVGGAEAVRYSYRGLGYLSDDISPDLAPLSKAASVVRGGMATFGQAYEKLTTIDFTAPQTTPAGTIFLGLVGASLARVGWNISKFHEQPAIQEAEA